MKSRLPAPLALRFTWIWGHRLEEPVPGLPGPLAVEGLVGRLALQHVEDVDAFLPLPLPVRDCVILAS